MSSIVERINQVREGTGEWAFPPNVFFELTHRCNLRCCHCFHQHSTERELPLGGVKAVLRNLQQAGVLTIVFSGGEVLVRPDLFEIAEYARELGLFHCFSTNCYAVTQPVARRIARSNPTAVDTSLHGARAQTHDSITGVTGSYDRTLAGLRHLASEGVRLTIRTSVMSENLDEISEIERIAREIGAGYYPDPMIAPCTDGSCRSVSHRLSDEQLKSFMKERGLGQASGAARPKYQLMCGAGRTKLTISPMGEVHPCVVWREHAGSALTQGIAEVWKGDLFTRIRDVVEQDLQQCSRCEIRDYCVRCPGMAHLEGNGFLGPSAEVCRMTRIAREVMCFG